MKKIKINSKVITLVDIANNGGQVIKKGEICTVVQSYRGYGIQTEDGRRINRVERCELKIADQIPQQ